MMPSSSCNGVRPDADMYCLSVFEMFLTTPFSNGEGLQQGWLPIGSPGALIHSGMLGGRLSVSAAADAPALKTTPPAAAAPLRRKQRRVGVMESSSEFVVLLIAGPRLALSPHETFREA